MDNYDKQEEESEIVRESNSKLLDDFESWMKEAGLKDKTISNHSSNIDFYINDFLLYSEVIRPDKGISSVNMFLGFWFIKKAMWSSPASVKSNAASLKKFYSFMREKGLIEKSDLDSLKETIKEEMSKWVMSLYH